MNDLISFEFHDKPVRTLTVGEEPWWMAKDVCDVLDLTVGSAMQNIDDDEKSKIPNKYLGSAGGHDSPIINESGLYSLILRSRKPEAKKFKKWITSEVLPSIRKSGSYGLPKSFSEALQLAADQAKALEEAKPVIAFYEAVTSSTDALSMSVVAKMLNMGKGRNQLFQFLREEGVLRFNREPYQKYVDRGWFRVIEQEYEKPNGETGINTKTLVYQKGIDGIRKLLEKRNTLEVEND